MQLIEINFANDPNPNEIIGLDLNLKQVKFNAVTLKQLTLNELSVIEDRYNEDQYDDDLYNYYIY